MQITLNQLVQLLSDRVGQPFSIPLQAELKVIFRYKIADWVQKILEKYPEQRRFFLKRFVVELERVSKSECPVNTTCRIYRTTLEVPPPIRTTYTLFDYVGDEDFSDGYSYLESDQLYWMVNFGSQYTKERPKYFYVNRKLYIANEDMLDNIGIIGIWADQKELNHLRCEDVPCYTDNDQLDVPGDIINTIVQDILKNELRLIAPELAEVTVDDKSKEQQ